MDALDRLLVLASEFRQESHNRSLDDFDAGYNLGKAHGLVRAHDLVLRAEVGRVAA